MDASVVPVSARGPCWRKFLVYNSFLIPCKKKNRIESPVFLTTTSLPPRKWCFALSIQKKASLGVLLADGKNWHLTTIHYPTATSPRVGYRSQFALLALAKIGSQHLAIHGLLTVSGGKAEHDCCNWTQAHTMYEPVVIWFHVGSKPLVFGPGICTFPKEPPCKTLVRRNSTAANSPCGSPPFDDSSSDPPCLISKVSKGNSLNCWTFYVYTIYIYTYAISAIS